MKLIKFLKFSFLIFFSLQMALTVALAAQPKLLSAASDNPVPLQFTPQISIPGGNFSGTVDVGSYDPDTGKMNSDLLAKYIQAIYNYGMGIVGILAAIVMMAGGVLWLTSGGSADKVGQAKELIFGSIIGLVLLLGSWIILNTINPDLLKLKSINLQIIKKINIICCEYSSQGSPEVGMIGKDDCTYKKGTIYKNSSDPTRPTDTGSTYYANSSTKKCEKPGCCVMTFSNPTDILCLNTTAVSCAFAKSQVTGGRTPASAKFEDTNCANVPVRGIQCGGLDKCGGNTATNCLSKEMPGYIVYFQLNTNFCYNNLCWFATGRQGEPCGNEGGYCMTEIDGNCPVGFNLDVALIGRTCGNNLKCCKPN